VSIQPGKGTFLKSLEGARLEDFELDTEINKERLKELFEVRHAFEESAAALAAERLTKQDIQDTKDNIDKLQKSSDEEMRKISLNVHELIAKASKNKAMIELLNVVCKKLWSYQNSFYSDRS
jgi:DNA-binding FadR family transcriptional regulator